MQQPKTHIQLTNISFPKLGIIQRCRINTSAFKGKKSITTAAYSGFEITIIFNPVCTKLSQTTSLMSLQGKFSSSASNTPLVEPLGNCCREFKILLCEGVAMLSFTSVLLLRHVWHLQDGVQFWSSNRPC